MFIIQLMQHSRDVSELKNKTIAMSVQKLQKATSEGRFRIKSLRLKSVENEGYMKEKLGSNEKNYEEKLMEYGFKQQFFKKLYNVRSEQSQLRVSEQKYQAFIRSVYQKLHNTKTLEFAGFNFQLRSAQMFLKSFVKINNRKSKHTERFEKTHNFPVICYDFTNCSYLNTGFRHSSVDFSKTSKFQSEDMTNILIKCLTEDLNAVKVLLRNMALDSERMEQIFQLAINQQKIYQLDFSNESSQTMNRIGNSTDMLYQFFKKNTTTSVVRLNNLALKKSGIESISKGISQHIDQSPLLVLGLKNNNITENAAPLITSIVKSGLLSLDLSQNPLSPNFFMSLGNWKASTLNHLDLSMTEMDSESLIFFFSRIDQNKALQSLILDNNNFSHHWFNQTKQTLQSNSSIEKLSMANCKIKRLCETFKGLQFNRYLKKLNLSNNQFDEGIDQLCVLISENKVITDLKLRFCNIKHKEVEKIVKSLANNDILKTLDLSENFLGEQGARQLIKTLNTNKTLNAISLDKMQIPLRLKKDIDSKLNANKLLKKEKQMRVLKKQNKIVKTLDIGTWDDVDNLHKKTKINEMNIKILNNRIENLEKDHEKKKHRFNQIMKDYRQRQEGLISRIDLLEFQLNQIDLEQKKMMQNFEERTKQAEKFQKEEEEQILALEDEIKRQTLKNMSRENELEDLYENQKYMKKKQEKVVVVKQQSRKSGFDTSAAVNSKRRSKNL